MDNMSYFKLFTLSELKESKSDKTMYFVLSFSVYVLIIVLNVLLIVTIMLEKTLHEPMYIFVCNQCINGLFGTTGFYPKFLSNVIHDSHVITYTECFLQIFMIYTYVQCDCTTLTVMAYDRYVAICRPLDYHSIMTNSTLVKLLIFSWLFPSFSTLAVLLLTYRLSLCGSHIDKLYCDNWSIVRLSCEPTIINNIYGLVMISIYMCFVVVIICSYIKLVVAFIKSTESKKKFMHTCLPHLVTMINFACALFFDTLNNRFQSQDIPRSVRNFLALEFLIIPPIFNPFVYGLKLTELRKRILRMFIKVKVGDPHYSLNMAK
ncbi:olfactory receptor 52J3-like [Megalops cyprinoides]|uniref:olfactory receptor 52J3-like n=1 Tax=Megalops cyprinoides TaxID=118141 RepID=UPI0018651129|nr:olfactory receptor 52J3-like [Megalops cyprinoides]